ncbi:cell envelope integrity protein TolA [Roseateles sp. DAIF2]|uniref:cell envelope integrity protein TolA n=1 Tax=Roseateles sp. DAIF2 TaxID=2714952 RepID=UPI0018A2D9CA|nr:cell envelope integrity protein TolA [Roseateles sp. DAIF2]QPF73836.1 cell envelope integrity protein TolA [Roseateles sp. DAIF2]
MSSTASALALHRDPLRPPPAPGLGRGILLALVAHGLLVLGLTAGLNWRSQTEPAFEAELWAAVPVAAAPREETPPEPEPEPVKPQPTPEPPRPDPRVLQEQRDAEIAAEREKKKKKIEDEKKKREEEEAERKKREQLELKDKKAREEQKAREDKLKEDKAKQEKSKQDAKKAEAALEKQRQENLRRIQGMAGATGAPNATGTALQSAGPSSSYAGRIKARIRPNIIYSDSGMGNPVAEAEVRAAPDGTILSSRLVKTSGDPEWDKAVLRAIEKTEVLPRDVDGRVPSHLIIKFQPRE